MVYKFTDTMAALISNAFSLSFILFDRLVAYFLEWRVVTDQDAVKRALVHALALIEYKMRLLDI